MIHLRAIRHQLCLSPDFMARCLQIDPETLERLERGQFTDLQAEISPRLEQRLKHFGWWDGQGSTEV